MTAFPHSHRVTEAVALLKAAAATGRAAFSSSLSIDDQVLTDLIVREAPSIEIFTIDTGRLPDETYQVLAETEARYRRRIEVLFPEAPEVEQFVRINGINGFRNSISQRKHCCEIRKVQPLRRALIGRTAWVTGLRRAQSVIRSGLDARNFDSGYQLEKFNPLINWSDENVAGYARAHSLPTNALNARGYPSIGCAPCTRAIQPGEDIRAGRWWWESTSSKECGLHLSATPSSGEGRES
jgi:phosphoadenosine phosphosulfate reductase